jgi:diaminopimelate epimerase
LMVDQLSDHYSVTIADKQIRFGAVSMGNPHAVIKVDDVSAAPVDEWGPALQSHVLFPQRVNVGFMQIINRERIRLRVYERGAGETLACGTGACAAVVVGISWGVLNKRVTVELSGGNLLIEWDGDQSSVFMTGPATTVFDGQINL